MKHDNPREDAAHDCESAASELEAAAGHMKVAAGHFKRHDIPHACAHILAAQGHLASVDEVMRRRAQIHSQKSPL